MHKVIEPKIMYFGTPVVLISTRNEDGTNNLAPMSSAWWLNQSCVLGLSTRGKTFENLKREKECVLNLPSDSMAAAIDKLALTTGTKDVPEYKQKLGFKYINAKFEQAGLTPIPSELVAPPRVAECPVHLEATVENINSFKSDFAAAIEVKVIRTYMDESILDSEKRHYVDTDKWRPLIMSFCEFYSLGENVHDSRLAKVF